MAKSRKRSKGNAKSGSSRPPQSPSTPPDRPVTSASVPEVGVGEATSASVPEVGVGEATSASVPEVGVGEATSASVPEAGVGEAAQIPSDAGSTVETHPVGETTRSAAPVSEASTERERSTPVARASGRLAPLVVRVRRQDGPGRQETRRIEEFQVERDPEMSVADVLRTIERAPVTRQGARVAPVIWDSWCLDETCAACAMNINGQVRPACGTRVADVVRGKSPLLLEPLRKFPVVRDLVVDRARYSESLSRLQAWSDAPAPDRPAGAWVSPERLEERRAVGQCIHCCACLEACPEFGDHSDYVGAAAINQAYLATLHSAGEWGKIGRIEALMAPGGVADCGKAQACLEVCPAAVPLVDSLQRSARATTRRLILGWLLG